MLWGCLVWEASLHLSLPGIIKHWKIWKVHQAAFSRAGEAMELSVNPLTVPTSCGLLIKIIILTTTNKLILLIVLWPRPSFSLIVWTKPTSKWIHHCHCPQEEKVFDKLRLSPLQPPSLQYFFTLLPSLPFVSFFYSMDFWSKSLSVISLFNKTRRCCFSVLSIKSLFPFTWSVAMPSLLSRF